jgi:hypothetical protein
MKCENAVLVELISTEESGIIWRKNSRCIGLSTINSSNFEVELKLGHRIEYPKQPEIIQILLVQHVKKQTLLKL